MQPLLSNYVFTCKNIFIFESEKKKNALKSESLKIYFKKRIEYFPSLFIFEKSIDHPKSI